MYVVKLLVVAGVVATSGYFLVPVVKLDQLAQPVVFAIASVIGVILGGLISRGSATTTTTTGGASAGEEEKETLFVGNLAFKASRDQLQQLFSNYGTVHSVRLMIDRETRRPRGFGFVEMDSSGAKKALKALDGYEFGGRNLRVNVANERKAA